MKYEEVISVIPLSLCIFSVFFAGDLAAVLIIAPGCS